MLLIYIFILTKNNRQIFESGRREKKKKVTSVKDAVNVWKWSGDVQPDVLHTHPAQAAWWVHQSPQGDIQQ